MDTRKRVLDWINKQRANVGADPMEVLLPGEPGDMDHCVITHTFETNNDAVIYTTTEPNEFDSNLKNIDGSWGALSFFKNDDTLDNQVVVNLPKFVAQFAMEFDRGDYPDLVE